MEQTIEELQEKYRKETENLLEKIQLREEMVGLLKIAKPEKVAAIQTAISRLDKSIESTEKIIALNEETIQQKREYDEQMKKLLEMTETMLEGMREQFADQPEKLEMLEAMLEDDGKTH